MSDSHDKLTKQEAQELLDNMYPPHSSPRNKKANSKLTQQQVSDLLDIVIGDNTNPIDTLSGVVSNFINPISTTKGYNIPLQPQAMPLLIQQVLFYMVVDKGYKQEELLNSIRGSFGKLFTKMPFQPHYYMKMRDYKIQYTQNLVTSQPKILFPYNGQKDKHLGIAIKNLVYQAGKFGRFVDVFGGTGSATLAFPHRGYTDYIYNELNNDMYSLNNILKTDINSFLEELNYLLLEFNNKSTPLSQSIDFDLEMTNYYNRHSITNLKVSSGESDIYKFRNALTKPNPSGVVRYLKYVYHDLTLMPEDFTFNFDNKVYTKQDVLSMYSTTILNNKSIDELSNYEGYQIYISYNEFINKLADSISCTHSLPVIRYLPTGEIDTHVRDLSDNKIREKQTIFYKWYSYLYNLLSISSNTSPGVVPPQPIRRALAYTIIGDFTTHNSKDSSIINRMFNGSTDEYGYPTDLGYSSLLKGFYKLPEIAKTLHEHFKDVIMLNHDFRQVLPLPASVGNKSIKSPSKPTLYYLDSPYLGTTDYDSIESGVSSFTNSDMRDLIDRLYQITISKDKFIFSCRACISGKVKDIKKLNSTLKKHLFEVFRTEFIARGKKLYVLTICYKDKNFFDVVKSSGVAEIMITNYEIQSFKADERFGYTENYKYEVYDYTSFINQLYQYL